MEELINFINKNIKLSFCINDFFSDNLNEFIEDIDTNTFIKNAKELWLKKNWKCHPKITNQLGKKTKKKHELKILGELINKIANDSNIYNVIDFGSGIGNLIKYLQNQYQLNCIGIEANNELVAKAMSNNLTIFEERITESTDIKYLQKNHIAVGNHCCGEFGSNVIKQFISCKKLQVLIFISCCYHQIKTFPLSNTLKAYNIKITLDSLCLANHWSPINTIKKKKILYRCMLQIVFQQYYPKYEKKFDTCMKWKKKYNKLDFYNYVITILKILNENKYPSKKIINDIFIQYSNRYNELKKFWNLRNVLGGVIEHLIILDRKLYLLENNLHADIVELYNPNISSKSIAIIARK